MLLEAHQGIVLEVSNSPLILVAPCKRYSLRAPEGLIKQLSEAGIDFPERINQARFQPSSKVFCLGPDEWFLACDQEYMETLEGALKTGSDDQPYSLVDISHRNVGLSIAGPDTQSLLNQGCPLDLSLRTFPVGKVTRTVFERAEIILARTDEDAFHVEIWRSFAPYFISFFHIS